LKPIALIAAIALASTTGMAQAGVDSTAKLTEEKITALKTA